VTSGPRRSSETVIRPRRDPLSVVNAAFAAFGLLAAPPQEAPMRLTQILPWTTVPPPSGKRDDKDNPPKAKPPDVEAGVSGVQVHAVAPRAEPWSDKPPPDGVDITV
jgi:hypothetical protein